MTHDQVEAMTLGDRVVVMKDGRVQQVGTPLEIYSHPANKFVAGFIGAPSMNFIDVTLRGDGAGLRAETPFLSFAVPASQAAVLPPWRDKTVTMGVRPEHLTLGAGAPGCSFDVGVEVVEQLGVEISSRLGWEGDARSRPRRPGIRRHRGRQGALVGVTRTAAFLRPGHRGRDPLTPSNVKS